MIWVFLLMPVTVLILAIVLRYQCGHPWVLVGCDEATGWTYHLCAHCKRVRVLQSLISNRWLTTDEADVLFLYPEES